MADFEDNCFRNWLNRIDAILSVNADGYDYRRALGSVVEWRHLFDFGDDEQTAIASLRAAHAMKKRTQLNAPRS